MSNDNGKQTCLGGNWSTKKKVRIFALALSAIIAVIITIVVLSSGSNTSNASSKSDITTDDTSDSSPIPSATEGSLSSTLEPEQGHDSNTPIGSEVTEEPEMNSTSTEEPTEDPISGDANSTAMATPLPENNSTLEDPTSDSPSMDDPVEDDPDTVDDTSTPTPVSSPSATPDELPFLTYQMDEFNWLDKANWKLADHSPIGDTVFTESSIKLSRSTKDGKQPMRTTKCWSGEKIVYIEWTSNSVSDTNIWMLNKKIDPQFAHGNGWPYYGELDIFEMFNQDALLVGGDHTGIMNKPVNSYALMTMHFGKKPFFCPATHSKFAWYQNNEPMTTSCGAQFDHVPNQRNSMAVVFGKEGPTHHYIELISNPSFTYGRDNTVDINPPSGLSARVDNTDSLYWGVQDTNSLPGHNAATGFPYFEEFCVILEEQFVAGGEFEVHDIKVYTKA